MYATDRALNRQGLCLEYLTIAWCVVEAGVSVWSGVAARSIALIGFGLDSAIEVFAALVVVWQLHGVREARKRLALRLMLAAAEDWTNSPAKRAAGRRWSVAAGGEVAVRSGSN